jgi:FemAB-related protein (PEP-CTERM system-associated)
MRVESRLAGRLLVSVPYGVYGGTLADDPEAHDALLAHAQQLANEEEAQWIDIRSIELQWPDLPAVRRYVTFRKQLPEDPGRILTDLPRKSRAAARHARTRFGLEVTFGDEHLNTVWLLYSRSMRRLASVNYPMAFFQSLIERTGSANSVRETGTSGCVRHLVQLVRYQGNPIGGLISFVYRDTLMPYFAGVDERHEKVHPNNFLYMTAMEQAVRLGCRVFDFGRSRVDNRGPYNFKRFQGFEPTPLHYQYYVPRGGRAPDLHPANPKLRLARQIWPRLPLGVTRPLGAWLAKSIPG